MQKTNIQYLTHTWNPIAMRCTPISEGCANCWHIKTADRLGRNPKMEMIEQAAYLGATGPVLVQSRLLDPVKRKKPARIGVQFMGDLFHPDVSDEMIDQVISSIAHDACHPLAGLFDSNPHTGLILTKRPERILNAPYFGHFARWSNIWLGVSVCNNDELHKIDTLLKIPAKVRFVSFEPLLSRIKAAKYAPRLDWAVIGCESGGGRRQTDMDWIIDLKDTFVMYDKPVFIKQAEIAGKLVSMPKIDGQIWNEYPKG